jgi:hypothetical protein
MRSSNASVPLRKPPSARDQQIYAEVVLHQRPQPEVAREFGVSQPRVTQIVARVRAWVEAAPAREAESAAVEAALAGMTPEAELPPREESAVAQAQRLHLARERTRAQLEAVYAESLAAWRQSQEETQEHQVRSGKRGEVQVSIRKSQTGRTAHLNQAMHSAIQIARLDGVAFARDYTATRKPEPPASASAPANSDLDAVLATFTREELEALLAQAPQFSQGEGAANVPIS